MKDVIHRPAIEGLVDVNILKFEMRLMMQVRFLLPVSRLSSTSTE